MRRWLPWLEWARHYDRDAFASDAVAALIVTILLVPQSLAYAMLAGLPPQVGLYASMLPLVAYAIFGSSRTLAVGPVAVTSLMSAAAASRVAEPGTSEFYEASMLLALLGGLMLVGFSGLRAGFVANFLSYPVVSGFITAAAVLIAAGQIRHLVGVETRGDTLLEIMEGLMTAHADVHVPTLLVGLAALGALVYLRLRLRIDLERFGVPARTADLVAKAGPLLVLIVTTAVVSAFQLDAAGVRTVGAIGEAAPHIGLPRLDWSTVQPLLVPAFLIALVGFVESISIGHTLAAKRRQSIDADQELMGLGAANIASALSGGNSVTGGFARSIVATIAMVLLAGVEAGILAGVSVSMALLIARISRPHIAIVGQVPGTWRFRDYRRHDVLLEDTILSLRIDESLYFPNARFLQQEVLRLVSERPGVRHLVLQAWAINHIDTSALETLEELQRELSDMGVVLHLSEVKGPVMDRLERSGFLQRLTGRLFLTHLEAIAALREASKAPAAQASTS